MSLNKHDREQLLTGTFHGDWSTGLAADFATRAAAQARRSRRVRRALLSSGLAAGIAAVLALSLSHRATVMDSGKRSSPAYEIISEDELLTQLKGRPLLLVRLDDGTREIVLLQN